MRGEALAIGECAVADALYPVALGIRLESDAREIVVQIVFVEGAGT